MEFLIFSLCVFGVAMVFLTVFISGAAYQERKCIAKYKKYPERVQQDFDEQSESWKAKYNRGEI